MRMLEAISQGVVLCYVLSCTEDDANLHMYHYAMGCGHGARSILRSMRYNDITDECADCIGNRDKFIARYGKDYDITDSCMAMINEGYAL